jgi:hypothetical protein
MATTSTDPTVRPKSRPAVRGNADAASGLYPTAAWRATFTGSPDAHGQVLRSDAQSDALKAGWPIAQLASVGLTGVTKTRCNLLRSRHTRRSEVRNRCSVLRCLSPETVPMSFHNCGCVGWRLTRPNLDATRPLAPPSTKGKPNLRAENPKSVVSPK